MIYTEQDLVELSKQDLQHSRALRRKQHPEASRYLQSKLDPIGEDLQRLGSDYGGWVFSPSMLIENSEGTINVLAGAGEDLSFDLELNRGTVQRLRLSTYTQSVNPLQKFTRGICEWTKVPHKRI